MHGVCLFKTKKLFFKKSNKPKLLHPIQNLSPKKSFIKLSLDCTHDLKNTGLDKGPPGTTVLASCLTACKQGAVAGTHIYNSESKICSAATHSGVIDRSGGDIMVVVGAPQQ